MFYFIATRLGLWLMTLLSTTLRITALSVIDNGCMKRQRFFEMIFLSAINAALIVLAVAINPDNGLLYLLGRGLSLLLLYFIIKRYIGRKVLQYYLLQFTLFFLYIPLMFIISLLLSGQGVIYQIVHTSGELIPILLLIYLMKKHSTSFLCRGLLAIIDKIYLVLAIVYFLAEIMFTLSIIKNLSRVDNLAIVTSILLGSFSLIVLCMLIIIFSKERRQGEEIKHQSELLVTYTDTIESLYDDIRSYKHDINNILLSMKHYIDAGDMKAIKHFFAEEIEGVKCFDLDVYKLLTQMHALKIDVLKGLFLSKFQKATTAGVSFEIAVHGVIEDPSVNPVELCRLVGIFLDNAIEAAEDSEDKGVYIYLEQESDRIRLKISNHYNRNKTVILTPKRNHSTKGPNRGMGLYSAQHIIKRNKKLSLETKLEEQFYSQSLYILR